MIRLLKKSFTPLITDLHSHLIPQIDDGSDSLEASIEMVQALKRLGFRKIVTTPHIHPKYPNTPQRILEGLQLVKKELVKQQVEIELEAAAEYFVDENFMKLLEDKKPLLSFGNRYVLIESSFINKPFFFEMAVLKLQSAGYRPIFAHPERYQFLHGDITWLKEIKETGLLFQITLSSLVGDYGKRPRKIAEALLKHDLVDFLASDLHKPAQLGSLERSLKLRSVQKLIHSGKLLNASLY